ncbi:DUF6492 family protein [Arsukibacterium sp.]|uniref:DUF6492 family protein n=1 Tax=Arsukibacterium sp. TaxID=1977258 RepID=UPI001BD37614|nr:DUF6492 family protein [Arsukibacterium sp.]
MTELALLVKSYHNDFEYAERLMQSINDHNVDALPVYIVVPENDLQQFNVFASDTTKILSENLFANHLVHEETAGFRPGYINQEIIKLAFWELNLCDNYFCVDSDAEFIRDFTRADFMAQQGIPFTFLTEDRDLVVEPEYYQSTWVNRMNSLEKIRENIGYTGPWLFTVHGHAVFSAKVLQSFVSDFLEPRDWDYKDALAISPYEPTWYNTWLLHTGVIEIFPREPIVKTFHNAHQHLEYQLRGIRKKDAARGFLALVVNSNYSRGHGVMNAENLLKDTLAAYVPLPQLLRAFGFKLKRDVFIRRTPLRKLRVWLGAIALKIPGVRRFVQSG